MDYLNLNAVIKIMSEKAQDYIRQLDEIKGKLESSGAGQEAIEFEKLGIEKYKSVLSNIDTYDKEVQGIILADVARDMARMKMAYKI